MAIPGVPHTPANPNVLHPNKFQVTFAALPTIVYWAQSVNIPGLNIGEVPRQTPFIDLWSPGEKLNINPFSLTFTVDEDLRGWLEIYEWMRGMSFPKDFHEYKNLPARLTAAGVAGLTPFPQFSDAALTILDSKQNPKIRISFHNCFPTSLTDILLSSTSDPESLITADATFRFDLYEITKV